MNFFVISGLSYIANVTSNFYYDKAIKEKQKFSSDLVTIDIKRDIKKLCKNKCKLIKLANKNSDNAYVEKYKINKSLHRCLSDDCKEKHRFMTGDIIYHYIPELIEANLKDSAFGHDFVKCNNLCYVKPPVFESDTKFITKRSAEYDGNYITRIPIIYAKFNEVKMSFDTLHEVKDTYHIASDSIYLIGTKNTHNQLEYDKCCLNKDLLVNQHYKTKTSVLFLVKIVSGVVCIVSAVFGTKKLLNK
jgi:hypothetical protein